MRLPATCLFLAVLGPAFAQPPDPAFEAATIKPNKTGDGAGYLRLPGVTVSISNMSLKRILVFTYQVRDFQITGGPNWIDSDRFDMEAKATPDATMPQKRVMLQTLLRDRFQLALHRETKELPIYNLTVVKSGLKIQPLKEGACIQPDPKNPGPPAPGKTFQDYCGGMATGRTMIQATSATMPEIATLLSVVLDRTVVDKTGASGQFHLQVNFAPMDPSAAQPADAPPSDLPSIFTALQEQFGLRLDSSKGPVEVLVIDHAEKPSDN